MLQLLVSFGRIWVDAGHWAITACRRRSLGSPPSLSRIKGNYAAFVSQRVSIANFYYHRFFYYRLGAVDSLCIRQYRNVNESHHQLNADYANDRLSRMNGRFLLFLSHRPSSAASAPVCLYPRFSQRIVAVRPHFRWLLRFWRARLFVWWQTPMRSGV